MENVTDLKQLLSRLEMDFKERDCMLDEHQITGQEREDMVIKIRKELDSLANGGYNGKASSMASRYNGIFKQELFKEYLRKEMVLDVERGLGFLKVPMSKDDRSEVIAQVQKSILELHEALRTKGEAPKKHIDRYKMLLNPQELQIYGLNL